MVARPVRKAGRLQLTHTDHYTMVASLVNLPAARVARQEKEVRWKTGDKEGWKRYMENSKQASEHIKRVVENKDNNIEEVIKKVEVIETKLKFKSFGKYSQQSIGKRNAKEKEYQKDLSEEEKAKQLLAKQIERVEENVKDIEKTGPNKVGRIYEVSKQIKAMEKGAGQANAIKDPCNAKLIVDQEQIKNVTLKYCKQVLSKNEPDAEFKVLAKIKHELHKERKNERSDEGFNVKKEAFEKVVDKFKANNKRGYDFLTKASKEYQDAIYCLCKRIIEDETVPDKFRQTTLHQIWKKKPGTRKEDLDANRYIHCKEYLPRTVEAIVVAEMEKSISEATSKFQIGGVKGHRPQEHLFCVKSVQARYEKQKKLLIIYTNDVSKFFDKEVLADCMGELYQAGIDPRAYRMFSMLNEKTQIRVRTGCGFSPWEEAGDLLGQGSGGAAKVSALNLDRKLSRVFDDSQETRRGRPR